MKNNIVRILSTLALTFSLFGSASAAIVTYGSLAASDWEYTNDVGTWQSDSKGLTMFSAGYIKDTRIASVQRYDITSEDMTIYSKWQVDGDGQYMAVTPGIQWFNTGTNVSQRATTRLFTTSNTFAGSLLASPDTWYYTTFEVNNADQEIVISTSAGNYLDNGGSLLNTLTRDLSAYWEYFDSVQIYARLWDNRAGTDSSLTFGEVGFSSDFSTSAVPIPAAVWLFGSALMGLVGVRRKKA